MRNESLAAGAINGFAAMVAWVFALGLLVFMVEHLTHGPVEATTQSPKYTFEGSSTGFYQDGSLIVLVVDGVRIMSCTIEEKP